MFSQQDQRLIWKHDHEILWVEPWGPNSLRVRATAETCISENDWALLPPYEVEAVVRCEPNGSSIENGNIRALIDENGKLSFYNQKGALLLEEYVRNRKQYRFAPGEFPTGFASALDISARELKPHVGSGWRITQRFEPGEERVFGMGQYQQPYLNLKGCTLEMAHRNSQASVPFFYSSRGYGFLWNNPAVGRATFGKNITMFSSECAHGIDYWITAGDTPSQVMQQYARATGTVPMMPDYAMGFWQSKLRYQTQDELLEVAREYCRRKVPLSVIVIDFFHWTMQGEWRFDERYWPNPRAMVKELREMGVEPVISIWPTVDHQSENFEEMLDRGYLIRTERGIRMSMDFQGNTIHFDATNPEARAYVWEKVRQNYYDLGIQSFWLDEAEPEYKFYDFDLYRYHLGSDLEIGNCYPMMYTKGFYDGLKQMGHDRILSLVRCAWAGSQRYGALVWSGDIDSSFRSLRNQLAAGLSMAMSGIPWWTTDIGGFHGGRADSASFRELFARWFAFGTFCPVMRLHGDREPHSEPLGPDGGGKCTSGAPNEIWSYGEEIYEICKRFITVREAMRPYTTELMREAHESGSPVIRPLFYAFPDDDKAWEIEDTYMFGPDLLVAPILYENVREREVYLPEGTQWTNAWTGETLKGGTMVCVEAPLDQIPLFVREDASSTLQEMLGLICSR